MIKKLFLLAVWIYRFAVQYLHRKRDYEIWFPHFSMRLFRKCWLILIAVFMVLSSGCSPEAADSWRNIAQGLARQEYTITALTINLGGTIEYKPKCPPDSSGFGCAVTQLAGWRDRMGRIAEWIGYNSARFPGRRAPDLIVLQEVYSYEGCPGIPYNLADYEELFTLIRNIETQTGVRYRIAYWGPWKGACHNLFWFGYSGKALLYNSDFLVNVPPVGTGEKVWTYDSDPPEGTQIRESYPCVNPPAIDLNDPCSLIDGNYWTHITIRRTPPHDDGRWRDDPIFSRLRFKNSDDSYIHVYNMHIDVQNYPPSFGATNPFIDEMEQKYPEKDPYKLIYPPILIGDFNVNSPCQAVGPNGVWSRFEKVGWGLSTEDFCQEGIDSMGVLVGNQGLFPSLFPVYSRSLTVPNFPRSDLSDCGDIEHLWSDHCAVFVEIGPVPATGLSIPWSPTATPTPISP